MPRQTIVFVKWLFHAIKCLAILLLLLLFAQFALATHGWRQLAKGIEYQDLKGGLLTPWSHIHVFRIDLKMNKLALISAKELSRKHASVDEYAEHSRALLAINCGFFDMHYKPLGLRIDNNQQQNPIKNISWWGIFYTKAEKAYLSGINQYHADKQIDFAIQSGPRLLINRHIPPLKPGHAERSALCITSNGRVIILVTDNMPLSTTELAQLMKASPLYCENALNLDGGSSSQLSAQIGTFQLDVHGFSHVSDAVIVKTRTH